MKKTLYAFLLGMMIIYACKKEDKTITVTETVHDTINQTIRRSGIADPDVLTAGITVVYGTKSDAAFPIATTTAGTPVLDTMYHKIYQVVEGNALVIYPPYVSGDVAGYYVQIAGAKSHFKVDYAAAVPTRKAAGRTVRSARGAGESYNDGTIVINLPVDIVGDTFYVKYAAYDTDNRISAPVTGIAIVMPQGNTAFNNQLMGAWKYLAYKHLADPEWIIDTFSSVNDLYYSCTNNVLTQTDDPNDILLTQYAMQWIWDMNFGKYTFNEVSGTKIAHLNLEKSSCTNLVYDYMPDVVTIKGAFYYDAAFHRLTTIYDDESSAVYSYYTYVIHELTDHKLVLSVVDYPNGTASQYEYQFTK
jgi:hypothetical protein